MSPKGSRGSVPGFRKGAVGGVAPSLIEQGPDHAAQQCRCPICFAPLDSHPVPPSPGFGAHDSKCSRPDIELTLTPSSPSIPAKVVMRWDTDKPHPYQAFFETHGQRLTVAEASIVAAWEKRQQERQP